MAIKTISLNRLEKNLRAMLDECVSTGEAVVVEMPDHRMVTIQALEPSEDDNLTDELLRTNPGFRAKLAKSKAGARKPFVPGASRTN